MTRRFPQGVHLSQVHQQSKKCTNQAAIASSHRIHRTHRSLLLKCTPTEFTEFSCRGEFLCILRVPWDNTTQPKHLCAICAICGRIIKWVAWVWQGCHTLLSVFCGQYISAWLVQQRLLHPLTFRAFRPSSTSEINDYGYAPGWRLQPKPIVLARRPLLQHGRPA